MAGIVEDDVMTPETAARRGADPVEAAIGDRIRGLRHQQALSLQQVADRALVSVGYLSQVERGLSSPPIRDLMRIAKALDADLGAILDIGGGQRDGRDPALLRLAERRDPSFHAGVARQSLAPSAAAALHLSLITLEPGAAAEAFSTRPGEAAGLVLQGRLLLTLESTEALLHEGDSFRFLSHRPHRFANASPMVTRVVWAQTGSPRDV